MPTPIVYKRKALQFKPETTPGTAETTGFSEINAFDIECKPDVPVAETPGMVGFGDYATTATTRAGTVTFSFDVTNKSGGAPAWTALLAGCGYPLSTGVHVPTSKPAGAAGGGSCFTFAFNQDGRKQVVFGAMGNIVFETDAGGKIVGKATFRGILDTPTDASMPSITLPSAETVARFASTGVFTLGADTLTVQKLTLDLGASVQLIPSQLTASGFLHAVIEDIKAKGSMAVKAVPNATFRPLLRILANTGAAWTWRIGEVGAGHTITAPKLVASGEDTQAVNGVAFDVMQFSCMRSADAGDDSLTWDPTA